MFPILLPNPTRLTLDDEQPPHCIVGRCPNMPTAGRFMPATWAPPDIWTPSAPRSTATPHHKPATPSEPDRPTSTTPRHTDEARRANGQRATTPTNRKTPRHAAHLPSNRRATPATHQNRHRRDPRPDMIRDTSRHHERHTHRPDHEQPGKHPTPRQADPDTMSRHTHPRHAAPIATQSDDTHQPRHDPTQPRPTGRHTPTR